MSPSVRGAERLRVVALLALSGMVTGGLVGFALGVPWAAAGLPPASPVVAAALAGLAVLADVVQRRVGWPRPLAVRRQVPLAWGRLLGIRTAAVLYGARLGVGPLTILSTWLWWAAMAVALTLGPWIAAAAGAAFHLARTVTMVVAVWGGERTMSRRMAAVRRSDMPVATGIAIALGGLLVLLAW